LVYVLDKDKKETYSCTKYADITFMCHAIEAKTRNEIMGVREGKN
jgi:hypothetical protein